MPCLGKLKGNADSRNVLNKCETSIGQYMLKQFICSFVPISTVRIPKDSFLPYIVIKKRSMALSNKSCLKN